VEATSFRDVGGGGGGGGGGGVTIAFASTTKFLALSLKF
jgi:hypothetical protein